MTDFLKIKGHKKKKKYSLSNHHQFYDLYYTIILCYKVVV